MARVFAPLRVMVGVGRQVPPVFGKRRAAAIGDDLQAKLGQFQRPHDFGAQQAAHIGAVGVREFRVQAAADRCAANVVIALQHQHFQTGTRQVAGTDQSVVAGTDHDHIVFFCACHVDAPYRRGAPRWQRVYASTRAYCTAV